MNIEILQEFLFWCMMINIGIYALIATAVLVLPNFTYSLIGGVFGLDKESIAKTIYAYLATYKLLITFFNFVPWLATLIIK